MKEQESVGLLFFFSWLLCGDVCLNVCVFAQRLRRSVMNE